MKMKRAFGAAMLVLVILWTCSGCGRMTAGRLAVKTAAALAETPMTSQKTELDFETSVGTHGISLDMEMSMIMDLVMATDPYRAGVDAQVSLNILGRDITQNMQMYLQTEDDTLITYTHYDSIDLWQKSVRSLAPGESALQGNFDWLKAKPLEELALAEETRTIGSHETYVLSCTVNGAQLQSILNAAGSDADVSALEVPVVFYIDTKTFLPVRIELEIQGMNELLSGMLDQILGQLTALGLEFEIGTIHVVCSEIGYDGAEVPTIPQEALDADYKKTGSRNSARHAMRVCKDVIL